MSGGKRHFWTLGRKLGVTAWIYVASILINLGVSSACLLFYFKPEFRDAEAFYAQQQQIERIRVEVRRLRAAREDAQAGLQELSDAGVRSEAMGKALLNLEGSPVAQSLGPLWGQILVVASKTHPVAGPAPASREGEGDSPSGRPDPSLASLDRLLSEAIKTLGARRQASILAASDAQWWIIRILIASSCVAAALCVFGLWFVRKWVVQPVGVLKRAASQLRDGDFNLTISLPFDDEMGRLGGEISQMATQIARLQEQLLDKERQSAASEMITRLEEYMREPLSEIQALASACSQSHTTNQEILDCQQRIADTVSRFESWLHELNAALAPGKSSLQPTDVSIIVSDVLAAVGPTLERLQVRIEVNADPGLNQVLVDRIQLEQALIVLVTNAAEASEAGQTVRVRARTASEPGGCWELQVEDDGSGISPELIERIFLPFFTTKREGNGLGLGLARAIVRQHGGELRVESKLGKGSRFTIRLPESPPDPNLNPLQARIPDDRPEFAGPGH